MNQGHAFPVPGKVTHHLVDERKKYRLHRQIVPKSVHRAGPDKHNSFTQGPLGKCDRPVVELCQHSSLRTYLHIPRPEEPRLCEVAAPGYNEQLEHWMGIIEAAQFEPAPSYGPSLGRIVPEVSLRGQSAMRSVSPRTSNSPPPPSTNPRRRSAVAPCGNRTSLRTTTSVAAKSAAEREAERLTSTWKDAPSLISSARCMKKAGIWPRTGSLQHECTHRPSRRKHEVKFIVLGKCIGVEPDRATGVHVGEREGLERDCRRAGWIEVHGLGLNLLSIPIRAGWFGLPVLPPVAGQRGPLPSCVPGRRRNLA